MNLRAACAEPDAVQPKGHVSFSESGRGWNVRWRATSHAQNPVKFPRYDVRIRSLSVDADFGPGYVSPSSSVTFTGLNEGEEYEAKMQPIDPRTRNPVPGSEPLVRKFRATREN